MGGGVQNRILGRTLRFTVFFFNNAEFRNNCCLNFFKCKIFKVKLFVFFSEFLNDSLPLGTAPVFCSSHPFEVLRMVSLILIFLNRRKDLINPQFFLLLFDNLRREKHWTGKKESIQIQI